MAECYVAAETPGLRLRFWRNLGFRSRHPKMSKAGELLPGWVMTHVRVKPSFFDRLRFLFCREAIVRIEMRTDAAVDQAITASTFELVAPGEDRWI